MILSILFFLHDELPSFFIGIGSFFQAPGRRRRHNIRIDELGPAGQDIDSPDEVTETSDTISFRVVYDVNGTEKG